MLNLGFINVLLQKLAAYFFAGYRYKNQAYWFKKAVYLLTALKCVYWMFSFGLFFGSNSIVLSRPVSIGPIKDLAFILYNQSLPALNALFIGLLLLICLLGLFNRSIYLISDMLAWFLALNIHNQIYPALSGGDYLLNQFLFFNCFLVSRHAGDAGRGASLKVMAHNVGALAVMVQVCMAYLLSALVKLNNEAWQQGEAIARISEIRHFSLYYFPVYSGSFLWLYATINYLVLAYQALFPVLAWTPWFKRPFLLCGVTMHVYIGLVMGLPWFALVMIIGYIFFWPFKNAAT